MLAAENKYITMIYNRNDINITNISVKIPDSEIFNNAKLRLTFNHYKKALLQYIAEISLKRNVASSFIKIS